MPITGFLTPEGMQRLGELRPPPSDPTGPPSPQEMAYSRLVNRVVDEIGHDAYSGTPFAPTARQFAAPAKADLDRLGRAADRLVSRTEAAADEAILESVAAMLEQAKQDLHEMKPPAERAYEAAIKAKKQANALRREELRQEQRQRRELEAELDNLTEYAVEMGFYD